MRELRYTLLTDGPSDRAMIPILTWILRMQGVSSAIQSEWADLRRFRLQPRLSLAERIRWSIEFYPCDLLFVHRDAEREPRAKRLQEIDSAIAEVRRVYPLHVPTICVVPIRMQEAWLLFDEPAIRYAAGNSGGRRPLSIPPLRDLEDVSDPKTVLYSLLREASGLSGRRLDRFDVSEAAVRVTGYTDNFSPLRELSAFAALEADISREVHQLEWA